MKTYFDTGVLVKAYVAEADTPKALVLIRQVRPPVPTTHLHSIEIRNALRLKCGRGEITEIEMKASLRENFLVVLSNCIFGLSRSSGIYSTSQ